MKTNNLIVFFTPPEKAVNGGVMSLFSLCKESRRLESIHRSEVVISTYPGNETYGENDLFKNEEKVYSFDEIIAKWKNPGKVLLHIPETSVRMVNIAFREEKYRNYLNKIDSLHINIMNQNIQLMRRPAEVAELFLFTPNITQTTAHDRYTTQGLSNKYQTPVHHLSVYVHQGQYKSVPYLKKENLIIYSPDENPNKQKVLASLSKLKNFKTREIKNLSYEDYKNLTASAKFCITFGEGYDAYFSESLYSGSVGFAVYNDEFFPNKTYADIPSVFKDYKSMIKNLAETIQHLDNKESYDKAVKSGQAKLNETQDYDRYLSKIKNFYIGKYDLLPEAGTAAELIRDMLAFQNETVRAQIKSRDELKEKIAEQDKQNKELEARLKSVLGSRSWKVTKPLRKFKRN